MTMDMTMDARSRKALEGLKSLDPLSNTCWRMMNGFAPEIRMAKLEGISQVLPYDYPLTVTTFWYWLSKATNFDAQQQFKRSLPRLAFLLAMPTTRLWTQWSCTSALTASSAKPSPQRA